MQGKPRRNSRELSGDGTNSKPAFELQRKVFAVTPEVRSAASRAGASRAVLTRSVTTKIRCSTDDTPSPKLRRRPSDISLPSSPMSQQECGPLAVVEVASALQRKQSFDWQRQSSPGGMSPINPNAPVEIRSAMERRQSSKGFPDLEAGCNSVDYGGRRISGEIRRNSKEIRRNSKDRRDSKDSLLGERKRQRSVTSQAEEVQRRLSKDIQNDLGKEEKCGTWPTLPPASELVPISQSAPTSPTDKFKLYLDQGGDTEIASSKGDGLLGTPLSTDETADNDDGSGSESLCMLPIRPMETIWSMPGAEVDAEVPSLSGGQTNAEELERPAKLPASVSMIGLPDNRDASPKRSLQSSLLIVLRDVMSPLRKSVDTPVRPFGQSPRAGQSAVAYDNIHSLLPVATPSDRSVSPSNSCESQEDKIQDIARDVSPRRSVRQSLSHAKQKLARIWNRSG